MISLTIERRYATVTVRARIIAPSIERALECCGKDARVVAATETGCLPDLYGLIRPGGSSGKESVKAA